MRFESLIKIRLLHSIKEPYSLLFVIIAIIVAIQAAFLTHGEMDNQLKVAIVLEDHGNMGEKLIKELSDNSSFSMEMMSREKALRQLNMDQIEIVVVISEDFSESLKKGEFRNTLELYTSPTSQAPATISEPLVNGVMMLWMEEYSILETREYLEKNNIQFEQKEEKKHRDQMQELWDSGSIINIEIIELDGEEMVEDMSANSFKSAVKWYGAFCLFYLIVDASWIFDINKKSLRMRLKQGGVRRWQMISYHSAAPIFICIIGYLVIGVLCSILLDTQIQSVLITFMPIVVYLLSLMGFTLFVASLLKNILSLMFLAPVLTFVHGVLCGLLLELPEWTYVLKRVSNILPGRWLNESFSTSQDIFLWAILCGVIWIIVGLGSSMLREK